MPHAQTRKTDDESCRKPLALLTAKIDKIIGGSAELSTAVPGLTLYRNTAPTAPNYCSYEPSLLLIPRGKKRVELARKSYVFGQDTFLLTSVQLPVVSRVVDASEEVPYLAIFLKLDMAIVRDVLHTEDVRIPAPPVGTRGMVLGNATRELVEACSRMIDFLEAPHDIPFFSKLLQREIIYRLLQGQQGDRLRAVATLGEQSHRTAKAVTWLHENFENRSTWRNWPPLRA